MADIDGRLSNEGAKGASAYNHAVHQGDRHVNSVKKEFGKHILSFALLNTGRRKILRTYKHMAYTESYGEEDSIVYGRQRRIPCHYIFMQGSFKNEVR